VNFLYIDKFEYYENITEVLRKYDILNELIKYIAKIVAIR